MRGRGMVMGDREGSEREGEGHGRQRVMRGRGMVMGDRG